MKIPKLPSGVSIFRDTSGDREYWVLRMGKRWTGGQALRRAFPTASDAIGAWEQEVSKRAALGTGGYELSPAQLGEAIACFGQLEGTGLSLSEAVKLSLKTYRPKTVSIPLSGAIQGFLSAQKDRGAAAKTIIGYQSFLRLLAEGLPPKINVHEITEKEVRKHLSKYEKPASRNATIRHLRAFFRWTAKRGWREGDPTEQIDKTREIDETVSDSHRPSGAQAPRSMYGGRGMPSAAGIDCHRPFRGTPHWRTCRARLGGCSFDGQPAVHRSRCQKGPNPAATHRFRFRQPCRMVDAGSASHESGCSRELTASDTRGCKPSRSSLLGRETSFGTSSAPITLRSTKTKLLPQQRWAILRRSSSSITERS